MKYRKLTFVVLLLPFMSSGCAQNSQRMERPIAAATPASSVHVAATPLPKLPPPGAGEVSDAMHRVFGDALSFTAASQSFIAGDFNGDGAEDLAVIARPAPGKLAEVNSELANWIIQDADRARIASPNQRIVRFRKEELPKIAPGESVLAIIHGFGQKGWRDPAARQAYLVKHAAATLQGTAPSISEKAIRAMHLPVETEIIQELRGNKKGFLFWTGGLYAWHPAES